MPTVRVDLSTLFDALATNDPAAVTAQIVAILNENIAPSQLAGRLAIPAALGDDDGAPLATLVAAGRVGDWIRVIPPGPEPNGERRQALQAAVPLVAAALRAAPAIKRGLKQADARLPEPLFPKDIPHKDGAWAALRDAFLANDTQMVGRVLMGFYGSGTDYREIEGALYAMVLARFAADGQSLLHITKATQALDFVDWGDRVPALFQWLLPRLTAKSPEPEGAAEVRESLAQPNMDLDFVRTRLAISKPEAAGTYLRQAIARGTTSQVIGAIYAALKAGANGTMVGAQITVLAAEHLATVPLDTPADLDRAITALRMANASRIATAQVQDIRVLPIIFQAANLVNQAIRSLGDRRAKALGSSQSSPLQGGLIEFAVLRNLRFQATQRDEVGARATLRRYTQMTFPPRSVLGTLGLVAARAALAQDQGRGMLVVQEAGEDFLALTPRQQSEEGGGAARCRPACHHRPEYR